MMEPVTDTQSAGTGTRWTALRRWFGASPVPPPQVDAPAPVEQVVEPALRILLDQPSRTLALRHQDYVNALAGIILSSQPQFAIGVFGTWGTGKTTLMRAVKNALPRENVVSVEFNAWRYEKEPHLVVPLLDVVREALEARAHGQSSFSRSAGEAAKAVDRATRALVAGFEIGGPGFSFSAKNAIDRYDALASEANGARAPRSFYHASFQELSRFFSTFRLDEPRRRIVVFVDDLDRCLPENALTVLESMKLFFDLDGFVFVVGLDREVVEAAVDLRYTARRADADAVVRIRGEDYIKKIFQVPFTLPRVTDGEVHSLLEVMIADNALGAEQTQELRIVVAPHLPFVVGPAGLNPREIKRYINAYTMLRLSTPWLEQSVILSVLTVDFRPDWRVVKESLYGFQRVFLDALGEDSQNPNATPAIQGLLPRGSVLPADFVQYIQGPAAALLTPGFDIQPYLEAGESATSDIHVSGVVRLLAQLRATLDAPSVATASPLLSQLEGSLRSALPPRAAAQAHADVIAITRLFEGVDQPKDEKGWSDWREKADTLISASIRRLMDLSRFGWTPDVTQAR